MTPWEDSEVDYKVWSHDPKQRVKQEANNSPYVVTYHEDQKYWSCTCPHWINRLQRTRTRCKHIDEVILHVKQQERLQEEAAKKFESEGFDWFDQPVKPDEPEDDPDVSMAAAP